MSTFEPDEILEVERATWNRAAPTYMEATAQLTKHAVDHLIENAALGPGQKALEVACGPGHLCRRMAESGAEVTGVDLATAMVEMARSLHPGVVFTEANAEELPFDAGTFDVVLVNFAIHHFPRPDQVCREIHRVLKPGGRFVFAGPIEQFGFGAFIEGLSEHHTLDELPHGPIYLDATRQDYEKLVADAGFLTHDVSVRQLTLHLDSLETLLVAAWDIVDLRRLPEEKQNRIRETTIEKAEPYRTDDGYAFPDKIVVGIATR